MPVSYDPALIGLSVLIAIQGGYVSLQLACRLAAADGPRRKGLLSLSAIALGGGIWAMHFIGMLALQLPVVVNYDLLLTLISLLVSILVTGIGLYVASYGRPAPAKLAGGGLFMGLGISAMHYIGMAAVRANSVITYSPSLVAASIAIGIAASTLALWLALALSSRALWRSYAGAVALGLAISGMHYTAMAAASFRPARELLILSAPALSQPLLAIVVALATFFISGFFLLVLLPDRPHGGEVAAAVPGAAAALEPAGLAGGVDNGAPSPLERLAVEQNRRTLLLEAGEIVSIKADAHYTWVFDGKQSYFCSHSLAELEPRLDPSVFVRVHRSHIVNLAHARSFERVRDQGVLYLDAETEHRIPVSRSNVPKLRAALGL